MDQVFRKIANVAARRSDRMAGHVCSWPILLQKSVEGFREQ
jgi:hypothetical protein